MKTTAKHFWRRQPKSAPKIHRSYQPGKFLELGRDQCRFHLSGNRWCGEKVADATWCAEHARIVFRKLSTAPPPVLKTEN